MGRKVGCIFRLGICFEVVMKTQTRTRGSNVRPTVVQNAAISSSLKDDTIFAMELIQQKSLLLGLNTMSLDDINNEIKQARSAEE